MIPLLKNELLKLIKELNTDPIVHGIIVQRPLPPQIDKYHITDATEPTKERRWIFRQLTL